MKNIVLLVFLFAFFQSCSDCKRSSKFIFEDKFNLVVQIPPSEYPDLFKTKGYDPVAKEMKTYRDGNRWLDLYKKEIEEGHTIVKKRENQYFISIRKTP